MVSMEELLNLMVQRGGSDLHLSVGTPPRVRIDGKIQDTEYDIMTPEMSKKLIYSVPFSWCSFIPGTLPVVGPGRRNHQASQIRSSNQPRRNAP